MFHLTSQVETLIWEMAKIRHTIGSMLGESLTVSDSHPLNVQALDYDRLRSLSHDEQDAELKRQVDASPTLRADLTLARKFWHAPFKHRVLKDFQKELPGITTEDIEALMACYDRVYG